MRVAIMQPYFLPYIGYYQLVSAVDLFLVYDNIKYTKKGWINRNRMLQNGTDAVFSLPLKSASDSCDVVQRSLATDFNHVKLLEVWRGAYARAPYFKTTTPLLEKIVSIDEQNLFRFVHNSIIETCAHLELTAAVKVSSTIPIDHSLKGQDKVLALCEAVGAKTYINPIGGSDLYSVDAFRRRGMGLQFIKSHDYTYPQWGDAFIPWLSILDVLMFNAVADVQRQIRSGFHFV